jgi:hypothetical protein
VSAAFTPVGLVHNSRVGNKLSTIALVDTCFTVGVDLVLVVVDAGTCIHDFVVGFVCVRESTVELNCTALCFHFFLKSSSADLEESLAVSMYWRTVETDSVTAWMFSSVSLVWCFYLRAAISADLRMRELSPCVVSSKQA